MPTTFANSTPPLSRPLCASHEPLTTRRYCHASIPFRTLACHLPCPVLATTNTNHQQPTCISVPLSTFFTHPPLVLIRAQGTLVGDYLWSCFTFRFIPAFYLVGHLAISCLFETAHHAQSEFGNLSWQEICSVVSLLMTDPSLVLCFISFTCPILFPKLSIVYE
jgi:hypothetical protein